MLTNYLCLPQALSGGSAHQLMHMMKVQTGQDMKYSQAQSIIKEKQGQTTNICINQFFLLESYLKAMELSDPNGTYIFEAEPCSYRLSGDQLKRFYVAWGATKHFWLHSR